jgi:hypothetical protein
VTAPVQYGTRIGAFVLYLLHYQLLPEKHLAALMADLFGVQLVTATIARISQGCAKRFQGFADAVRDRVAAAPVKHPCLRRDKHGRNRLSDRRQDAMAAYRLDHLADILPCLTEAGQLVGSCHRHCRA